MQIIHNQQQIPEYSSKIDEVTIESQKVPLCESLDSEQILVLEHGSREAVILSTAEFRDGYFSIYNQVLLKLKKAGYLKVHEYSIQSDLLSLEIQGLNSQKAFIVEGRTSAESKFIELVTTAYRMKATDIHIIRGTNQAEILFRMNNGKLESTMNPWMTKTADDAISVAYNTMGENKEQKWDRNRLQDADLNVTINIGDDKTEDLKIRYAGAKTKKEGTWKATLRLLPTSQALIPIEKLGYNEKLLSDIYSMLMQPNGVLVLTGTVNSGKSTSIASFLNFIKQKFPEKNIHTVEDPPEYDIPGVVQTPVIKIKEKNDPDDVSFFGKSVRNILRHDINIIFIGEIRDKETAMAAVNARNSGHLVVTTLHVGSALDVPIRLEQLGVPRYMIATPGFFAGIVCQSLVPTILDDGVNAIEVSVDDEQKMQQLYSPEEIQIFKEFFARDPNIKTFKTRAHITDAKAGQRTLCAEAIIPTKEMSMKWRDGLFIEVEEEYIKSGGRIAMDHAVEKIAAGQICPRDALDVYANLK